MIFSPFRKTHDHRKFDHSNAFGFLRRRRSFALLIGFASCGLAAGGALAGFELMASSDTTPVVQSSVVQDSSHSIAPGLVAKLTSTTIAYRFPGGPLASPVAPSWYGSPLSLPVIASRGGELEVRLPTRPNGTTTWISRSAVHLYRSPYRIVVDLDKLRLLVFRNNKLVLDAPAGTGTVADPTPTGHFFVAFFAKAPSPAWGPFVLVTSAHSNAISDWEESGDAIVAIHGSLGAGHEIGLTGARVSHGCVRLHRVDLVQLRAVPDGSPVNIVP